MGKNHMNEVAALLGVELDEEFIIEDYGTYVLTWKGLVRKDGVVQGLILTFLLTGELKIRRKPWKPIKGEIYYYVTEEGLALSEDWADDNIDLMRYKLGNCYRTIADAEVNAHKWEAFYASDEVIKI